MNNIAILGPENTFSDRACFVFETKSNLAFKHFYFNSVSDTMSAVNQSMLGILPIENTLEGFVQQHMDLLIEYDLSIVCEVDLNVSFSFVSHQSMVETKNVYVQYAAKNQCLQFFKQHSHLVPHICESNIESFNQYQKDPHSSAIIPLHVYQSMDNLHGIEDVTDESINQTRFFIVKSNDSPFSLHDNHQKHKAFIAILPDYDRPGLLFDILKVFARNHINLLSIMSRPTKKQMGTYRFFIEMEIQPSSVELVYSILSDLNRKYHIKLLGIYPHLI